MGDPKAPISGTSLSVGLSTRMVQVQAITPDGQTAVCTDRTGAEVRVPMFIQPAKGALPEVGEWWIITQGVTSVWTFSAIVSQTNEPFIPQTPSGNIPGTAIEPGTLTGTQIAPQSVTSLNLATAAAATNIILDPQFTSTALNATRLADHATTCTWSLATPNATVTSGGTGVCTLALMPSALVPLYVNPGEQYYMSVGVTLPAGAPGGITAGIQFAYSDGSFGGPVLPVNPGPNTVAQLVTIPSGEASAYVRLIINGLPAGVSAVFTLPTCYITQGPNQLQGGSVGSSALQVGAVTATSIAAGAVTASAIAANSIDASKIVANAITAAQIAANTITAAQLAAGIVYATIVDGTTITGAQLVADGTSGEFLVYNGTPGLGNLIGSWSGVAGTDQYTNPYPAGLNVTLGSITGTVFSGLNFVLNNNGLFFYTTSAPITLVQSNGAGNLNYTTSSSPVTITVGSLGAATTKGNTVYFIVAYYTVDAQTVGATAAKLTHSGAAMTRIVHQPFQGSSAPNSIGWIDVWASNNTPGGDTQIAWTTYMTPGYPMAYMRMIYEFAGLGNTPTVDVTALGGDPNGTDTAWSSGTQASTAPSELWLGGVAAYYNPSATMPTITGPAGPWINAAQQGGQIGGYSSSMDFMVGYQVATATGSMVYSGTFQHAQNWGAFAIAIQPSTLPGLGSLALSLSAVSGSDSYANQFPVGYMGKVTAIQPGSSPVVPEGWHNLTLTGFGTVKVARYKMLSEANCLLLEVEVQSANPANGTIVGTLPAAYVPVNALTTGPGVNLPMVGSNQTTGQSPHIFLSGASVGGACNITTWGWTAGAQSGGGRWVIPLD